FAPGLDRGGRDAAPAGRARGHLALGLGEVRGHRPVAQAVPRDRLVTSPRLRVAVGVLEVALDAANHERLRHLGRLGRVWPGRPRRPASLHRRGSGQAWPRAPRGLRVVPRVPPGAGGCQEPGVGGCVRPVICCSSLPTAGYTGSAFRPRRTPRTNTSSSFSGLPSSTTVLATMLSRVVAKPAQVFTTERSRWYSLS